MKQILQNMRTGATEIEDIPVPLVKHGHVLIKSEVSIVSVGTERMLVEFGKANYIQKARQQPDKVKEVINKVKTDGLLPTFNAVKSKLDQPLTLGYSNAGVIIAVGEGAEEFSVGDRVVSNGHHAEIVQVPKNLCAKVPAGVEMECAAFTVIASISLQGVRLAQPTLGEKFVVIGLGLIGLLTVQILKAHGCRVLAADFDHRKLQIAKEFGADIIDLSKGINPIAHASQFSKGRGVDGVIITASTNSNEPIKQAAQMCRKRGRIIMVGVTGLELSRADFYEKELTFQVSCSYGPGRYDPLYEEKGQDYPIGFVRWTEKRNFEAILDMLEEKKLDVMPLITHRFSLEQAKEAYQLLSIDQEAIGIVLQYPIHIEKASLSHSIPLEELSEKEQSRIKTTSRDMVIGMIGAGNFTNQMLLPALRKTGAKLHTIASSGGVNGVHVGKRFGFQETTTDASEIINHPDINTIFITTRHNSHAKFVKEALLAGKHVFVEKPLCLNIDELNEIKAIEMNEMQKLMVGFNRRFAPQIRKMKDLLSSVSEPKTMVMLVNAGYIPASHWSQDNGIGGGRIIGEGCHFIDLLRYLAGAPIVDIQAVMVGQKPGLEVREDKMTITLSFADGSVGTLHYFANGHKSYPKEKLDVFVEGKVLSLDNFKTLKGYGWSQFKNMNLWNQDKGHQHEIHSFVDAIQQGTASPIPHDELFEVTKATIDCLILARNNKEGRT